jgi:hypothetical protein
MNKTKTYFKGIQVPKDIDFSESSNKKKIRMRVLKPEENMQDNVAAFESWALILHAKSGFNVEMMFNIPASYKIPFTKESCRETNKHFLRFLFRAWKFAHQMKWFTIDEGSSRLCVQGFESFFLNTQAINNRPISLPGHSKKPDKKVEHILENIFVISKDAIKHIESLSDSQNINLPKDLFNQLPNGLFIQTDGESDKKTIREKNRIFPTGYIDLWGINEENDLCVFELKKKGNNEAGIISELYFYAHYTHDIFLTHRLNKKPSKYRGYEILRNAVEKGIKKIHACFLAPEYHSEIRDRRGEIQDHLNSGETNINYHFLTFDQKKICELSDCLPS